MDESPVVESPNNNLHKKNTNTIFNDTVTLGQTLQLSIDNGQKGPNEG